MDIEFSNNCETKSDLLFGTIASPLKDVFWSWFHKPQPKPSLLPNFQKKKTISLDIFIEYKVYYTLHFEVRIKVATFEISVSSRVTNGNLHNLVSIYESPPHPVAASKTAQFYPCY